MAKLSAELERTFVRLWTHCDDEGRCEDRPRILKASLYPEHEHITAESLDVELDQLQDFGLVLRYEIAGRGYIQVCSWDEYQKPQKSRRSKYPPFTDGLQPEGDTSTRQASEGYGPGEGVGEGDGIGVGEGDTRTSSDDDGFSEFWDSYPPRKTPRGGTKGSKQNAAKQWVNLSLADRSLALSSLPLYAQVVGDFSKDAERYLRHKVWEGLDASAVSRPNGHKPYANSDEWTPAERGQ